MWVGRADVILICLLLSSLLVEAFAAKRHVQVGTANLDVLLRASLPCARVVLEGECCIGAAELTNGAEVLDLLRQRHESCYRWPGLLAKVAVQRRDNDDFPMICGFISKFYQL